MEHVPSETSLVIAGSWNAAILTPNWVLKHGLARTGEERVQIFFPAGTGLIFEFPKYTLDAFSYVVRPDVLIVTPPETTQSRVETIEEAAAKMLEALRHTPVTGVGHNFEFRDSDPEVNASAIFTGARQDLADQMPTGWESAATNIVASFKRTDSNVIVNITRLLDAGTMVVKFNFHHAITTIDQAIEILNGGGGYSRMWDNFVMARDLIQKLYGDSDVE
jgi:hypothetical protein